MTRLGEQVDIADYDLGSTDTIVELSTTDGTRFGWFIDATGSADYVVEMRGDNVGWKQVDSYSSVTSVDDALVTPEGLRLRIRNTSTNTGETADVMLGVCNQ
jgi:hypothetical protein